jgi:hypothetical protein
MEIPRRDAKTQRNARIYSGLFPRKDGISRRDAKTQPSFHYGGQAQRHATIDSLQVNQRIVEELVSGFRNLTLVPTRAYGMREEIFFLLSPRPSPFLVAVGMNLKTKK